ncbi:LolA-related protein [Marilutibacter spongiae]|uniref:LolA-related protein n=1 Tax=Marilutibacter spongiae TaxID=2025720 RepID=UPI001C71FCDB|nr:LolA-related protein [Lysobacter spongiae]
MTRNPLRTHRPGHRLASAALLALAACAAVLPLGAAERVDAPADVDWVLARIVRPAPARTPFLELRGSALLKAPLRITGEYRRPDGDTLVREVQAPYRETTTIAGGEIVIEREGRGPRRFSMSRAPELAGLQSGFGALLGGDRLELERHYRVTVDGSRRQWTLHLVPRDAAVAARLSDVRLRGRGAELRCIESRPVGGDPQRTLLAGAVVDAQDIDDGAALRALCDGAPAPGTDAAAR